MSKVTIIHGNALDYSITADLIMTDPPFDMPGGDVTKIVLNQRCDHLVLLTTMRQLLEINNLLRWHLAFDFVFDAVAPKKSRSPRQPHYTHHTGVYMYKPGAISLFNRKLRQRSDVFEGNGYWPTLFHAPRERHTEHGMAKNQDSMTDLLGSFENINHVLDPFAGSGTIALASYELGIDCTVIDISEKCTSAISEKLSFLKS